MEDRQPPYLSEEVDRFVAAHFPGLALPERRAPTNGAEAATNGVEAAANGVEATNGVENANGAEAAGGATCAAQAPAAGLHAAGPSVHVH